MRAFEKEQMLEQVAKVRVAASNCLEAEPSHAMKPSEIVSMITSSVDDGLEEDDARRALRILIERGEFELDQNLQVRLHESTG